MSNFMCQNQWLPIIGFLLLYQSLWATELPVPQFLNQSIEKTESGYFKLSWRIPQASFDTERIIFELQKSMDADFQEVSSIYRGPDYATFLSGIPNGNYYYRIRSTSADGTESSKWSPVVLVEVKHQSLRLALWLFGMGAIIFLLTVLIVVRGAQTYTQNQA